MSFDDMPGGSGGPGGDYQRQLQQLLLNCCTNTGGYLSAVLFIERAPQDGGLVIFCGQVLCISSQEDHGMRWSPKPFCLM
jgi:hypothetical protein